MSVVSNVVPIHDEQMISYPYGVIDSGYSCGWHTGVDLVPHGSTENYPLLYGCVASGTVVYTNYTDTGALGVQVQFQDDVTGLYWRYCHMQVGSVSLSVGDHVDYNTIIGRMGATGNVTGRHLHLECSTSQAWICDNFVNPCTELGIPNEDDLVIEYGGTPPVPPTPTGRKSNWRNLFRKKYNIKFY